MTGHTCCVFCAGDQHAEFSWSTSRAMAMNLSMPAVIEQGARRPGPSGVELIGRTIDVYGRPAEILAVVPVSESPVECVAELRGYPCELWLWRWVS